MVDFRGILALGFIASCTSAAIEPFSPSPARRPIDPVPAVAAEATPTIAPVEPAPRETRLGVRDTGIFSDLDDRVEIDLPADLSADRVTGTIDDARSLMVVYVDGFPAKVYPLEGQALRPGDRDELAPYLLPTAIRHLAPGEPVPFGDRDHDGIPDPLDILIGAHKAVLNGDAYVASYVTIPYPNGDVPRTIGVCTDVVVRAVRNAGLDLQSALHQDILAFPSLYPTAKKPDASIDHRRVQTLLPYFKRFWQAHSAKNDDPADPLRPGDVVLLDTFPERYGPDHIGVVSEHKGESRLPLVINNWTDGTRTKEMDLLSWVPVTHRFRIH